MGGEEGGKDRSGLRSDDDNQVSMDLVIWRSKDVKTFRLKLN